MATTSQKRTASSPAVDAYHQTQKTTVLKGAIPVIATVLVFVVPLLWSRIPSSISSFDLTVYTNPISSFFQRKIFQDLPFELPLSLCIKLICCAYWVLEGLSAWTSWKRLRLMKRAGCMKHTRSYYRIRIPQKIRLKEAERGEAIITNFAGRLPQSDSPLCPIVLRWTGIQKEAIQQGISLWSEQASFIKGILQYLKTIGTGTEIFLVDDPLHQAIKETDHGWLLWCDVSLINDPGFTLPFGKTESLYLPSLLESLIPTAGIQATDIQIMLKPSSSRTATIKARYWKESLKQELDKESLQLLQKKASSSVVDVHIRLLVVCEDYDAGIATLQTIVSNVTSNKHSFAHREQGLRANTIHTYELPTAQPIPIKTFFWNSLCFGTAMLSLVWVWTTQQPLWMLVLPFLCIGSIPFLPLIREQRSWERYWAYMSAIHAVPSPWIKEK